MDVVVRNIAPYGARMRWPDPTTPGNLTKATVMGCSSCGPKKPSFAGTALGALGSLGALTDAQRAVRLDTNEAFDTRVLADEEREANKARAAYRLAGAGGIFALFSVGTAIATFVHGYNRNRKNVGWGLAWGAFGLFASPLALGWMLGQKAKK